MEWKAHLWEETWFYLGEKAGGGGGGVRENGEK